MSPSAAKQRDWHLLEFRVLSEDRDAVVELLWSLETVGLQEESLPEEVLVRAFFWPGRSLELLRTDFEGAARRRELAYSHLGAEEFRCDPTEWVENFKKSFKGFAVTPNIYVHPSWEKSSEMHPVNVVMEPGQAFGTGTHETTQLCIAALEEVLDSQRNVLDVGTGSGILAITLRKLRPDIKITAIDNDPSAIEVAWRNFETNQTTDISLFVSEAGALSRKYDLIVANLALDIFGQRVTEIKALARDMMILSGFTDDQVGAIRDLFEADASSQLRQRWDRNGWSCLAIARIKM